MKLFLTIMQIICAIIMCVFYGKAIYIWRKKPENESIAELLVRNNKATKTYIIGVLFYVLSNIFFDIGLLLKK